MSSTIRTIGGGSGSGSGSGSSGSAVTAYVPPQPTTNPSIYDGPQYDDGTPVKIEDGFPALEAAMARDSFRNLVIASLMVWIGVVLLKGK